MLLRKYLQQDFTQLSEIFLLAKKIEMSFSGIDIEIIPLKEDRELMLVFEKSDVVVAVINNEIVGFAGNNDDYISFMFVHPNHLNRGIGKLLLEAVLLNCKHPHLAVLKENIPAIKLYKSFGFEVEKEFRGVYNGIKCNCLKLVRNE
jgi:ribosomal protein S18 acetylase RimI-like enzyme